MMQTTENNHRRPILIASFSGVLGPSLGLSNMILRRLIGLLRRGFPKKAHQLSVHFVCVSPGYAVRPVFHHHHARSTVLYAIGLLLDPSWTQVFSIAPLE